MQGLLKNFLDLFLESIFIIAKMLIKSDKILKKPMNGEKSPPADRRTYIKRWMVPEVGLEPALPEERGF